ncbi:MAG: hypothetical protein HY854_07360 [Burkholderiales bacterium]|nr:hypothetical protein [Burkholderiales bacterium]
MDLPRMFQREDPNNPETDVGSSVQRGEGLDFEYRMLVLEQLERGGISEGCLDIEIRSLGAGTDGRLVFAGMLRLAKWEPRSALRVLLGLPLLQAKVRKSVRNSWLHDLSHFAGLWLHPSGQFEEGAPMNDLRTMIQRLEQAYAAEFSGDTALSVWSVPPELQSEPPRS